MHAVPHPAPPPGPADPHRPHTDSATSRGGRVKASESLAKADAIAKAHRAKAQKAAARIESLRVPAPFQSAADFLTHAASLARSLPVGVNRQIAGACGVGTSTVSKWFKLKKFPSQAALDRLAAWWKANRERVPEPGTTIPQQPRAIGLKRLPENISARLRRAARRRNIEPIDYAAQILDRHLPQLEEMD